MTWLRLKNPIKDSIIDLGRNLDRKLTFRDHIEHLSKNLKKFSGLISKVTCMFAVKCLLNFKISLAILHTNGHYIWYACLWHCRKNYFGKNEFTQTRSLRSIFFKNKYEIVGKVLEKIVHQWYLSYTLWNVSEKFWSSWNQDHRFGFLMEFIFAPFNTRRKGKGLLPLTFCRSYWSHISG